MTTELYVPELFLLVNENWLHQLDKNIAYLDLGLQRLQVRIVDAIDNVTELVKPRQSIRLTDAKIGLMPVVEPQEPITSETDYNPLLAANGQGMTGQAAAYTADLNAHSRMKGEEEPNFVVVLGAARTLVESTKDLTKVVEGHTIQLSKLTGALRVDDRLRDGTLGIDREKQQPHETTILSLQPPTKLDMTLLNSRGHISEIGTSNSINSTEGGNYIGVYQPTRIQEQVMTQREKESDKEGATALPMMEQHLRYNHSPKSKLAYMDHPAYYFSHSLPHAPKDDPIGMQYLVPNQAKIEPSADIMIASMPMSRLMVAVDEQLRLAAMKGGKTSLNEERLQVVSKQQMYDAQLGYENGRDRQDVRTQLQKVLYGHSNTGRLGLDEPGVGDQRTTAAIRGQITAQPATKTIQINLNRPMIEHFTVIAKDAASGLGDFKRQVEEVLLEILHSANAIN